MKKFNHVSELYEEQLRLIKLETSLEKSIRKDWKELKDELNPVKTSKNFISGLISQKIKNKLGEKMEKIFDK